MTGYGQPMKRFTAGAGKEAWFDSYILKVLRILTVLIIDTYMPEVDHELVFGHVA